MHVPGSTHLRPSIRALLRALDNQDPPPNRQKAITPKLLKAMFDLAGAGLPLTQDTAMSVTTELAIAGYFFAMRSCEFTTTPKPGRTKIIAISGIHFRDRKNRTIEHDSPALAQAHRVTITFVNQKNGMKNDRRTHQRTGDPIMCPVARLASLVQRIYRTIDPVLPTTTINAFQRLSGATGITSAYLRSTMRNVCTLGGGTAVFGFAATEIGTRSIRSGAAMSLFLMNHSVAKIMILGRWSSDAFLVYLRPQVLEWTNNMSTDMLRNDSFFDATDSHRALASDPRTRTPRRFNGGNESRQQNGKLNPHS
jgi:hypothetical protein